MRKQSSWIVFVAVLFLGWCTAATAVAEERDIEQKIEKMREQVKEFIAAEKPEEAERVEREIGRLRERLQRPESSEGGLTTPAPELKQRLVELERQLAEVRKQGGGDAAERITRQIAEIRQQLERAGRKEGDRPFKGPAGGLQERLSNLKQRMTELREAGRNDEANRLEQEGREMMRQAEGQKGSEPGLLGGKLPPRIAHLHEAAKHLHAAGLHDLADNVKRQAEQASYDESADRPAREADRAGDPTLSRRVDELSQALRAMHQQLERMEKQMQERSPRDERR